MDSRSNYRRPVQRSVDGFIVNPRGRTIGSSSRPLPESPRLQSTRTIPTINMRNAYHQSATSLAPQSGAIQPSRFMDPASVPLSRAPVRHKQKHHRAPFKKVLARSGFAMLIATVVVGGFLGFKFFRNLDKIFGGNPVSNLASLFGTTRLNGESTGRVNILLAGDSADDPGHQGGQLTDSIMVLSFDTQDHSAFMLSVPRDLWVNIPSWSMSSQTHQKINAANEVSSFNQPGYPSGGMGDLENVVQTNLGIPINYYALIDYTAFRDSVNAVGGITLNIKSTDPRGIYDKFTNLNLSNGTQTLSGDTALNLARARCDAPAGDICYGSPNSDFSRTQYQREMLVSLAQKATSVGVASNPVKISQLFDAVGNNVQTDLSLSDILRLDQLSKGLNLNSVQSYTYSYGGSNPLLVGYLSPDGEDALAPSAGVNDFTQLQAFYQKLTSNNPVVKESASVEVLNGGNTQGLAQQFKDFLVPKGINVTNIADAPQPYTQTEIIDNSNGKDPSTKQLLTSMFGNNFIPNNQTINATNANFVIILGSSQNPPTTTSATN